MTALCPGGGTSSPKAGLAEVVAVSSGAIALALQRYGAARLQFLIPLLGLPPIELPAFCSTDPPALPTFTSAEVYSILLVRLDGDYFSGLAKARDLVLRMLWYDLCQCDSGSPTTFVPPTLPTNTPDPVLPVGPSVAACISEPISYSLLLAGNGTDGPGITFSPFTVTSLVSNQMVTGLISPHTITYTLKLLTPPSALTTFITRVFSAATNGMSFVDSVTVPNGFTKSFSTWTLNTNNSPAAVGSGVIDFFCNGQVPGPTQPCCPPDPATQSSLDLILQMVTLIQRQAVPFAYVPSTVHAGLSGAGTIAIAGLIGVAINVTTIPGPIGREGTSPTEYFDMGFITFGTPDGYPSSYRLERERETLLPARCSAFTVLAYDLHPGVVVTITELVREP